MTRLLLVEDDKEVGRLLEHVLLAARYEVDSTSDVASARAYLDRYSYDLIIADARLPDGLGMEVADRAAEKGAKALIITGYAFQYPDLRRYDSSPQANARRTTPSGRPPPPHRAAQRHHLL
jgi:DNA-binding NtrC family response regulator